MAILPDQLIELLRNGGGASIDAGDYLPAKLLEAVHASHPKATLVIRNAERIMHGQRLEIARAAAGNVRFEL
jgi:hypothetical protein